MEKKRRARINASLLELKSLLLETIKKEGARHNKMEKADILEMAVKHLRQIQRQSVAGESSTEQSMMTRYSLGFNACVQEVSQYLDDVELKTKLLDHLANCVSRGHFPSVSRASSTPSGDSSSSSFLETSPRSSSSSLTAPLSPLSLSSVSPSSTTLSPESQRLLSVDVKGISLASRKNIEFPNFIEEKPKLYGTSQTVGSSQNQRPHQASVSPLLRAKLTTASTMTGGPNLETYAVLINPNKASGMKPGCGDSNNNDNQVRDSYDAVQVPEVNNNTITLPATALLGIRSAVPQQQQIQIQPLEIQTTASVPAPVEQHPPTYLQDASSLLPNTNRFLLIPTKTSTGENAYVLSTNFINPAQFSGYTIPVLHPQNQTPVFAAPFQQQAIQIAVSYPTDDQQRQTVVSQVPHIQGPVAAYPFDVHVNDPVDKAAATPLNLTSTSQPNFPGSQQHGNERSTPFSLVTSSTLGLQPLSPKPSPASLPKVPRPPSPHIDTSGDDVRTSEVTASSTRPCSLYDATHIGTSSAPNRALRTAVFQSGVESSNQVSSSSSTVIKQQSRDPSLSFNHYSKDEAQGYLRHNPFEYQRDLPDSKNPSPESENSLGMKQSTFFRPW